MPIAASVSFSYCKWRVVNVAPRPSARAASTAGIGAFETGHDPDRRLVIMVGQILIGGARPTIAFRRLAGRRRAVVVARPDHLVERLFVIDLDCFLFGRVLQHQKAPTLGVAAAGRLLS